MKKRTAILLVCLLISISPGIFPQLDSVFYLGPSQGSVSGGATQTTDNFTDQYFAPGDEQKIIPPVEISENKKENLIFNWDGSTLPSYKYVEDSPSEINNSGNSGQTVLLNSFLGIPMTNYIPPDPTIAAGPNHIIVCANSIFRILDKQGNVLKIISAGAWWSPAWPDENGDPQVIYDHFANRWVLVWMQVNSSAQTAGNLIAYSDDDDPLGTWYMYRLDTKMHGTVSSNTWGDYPKIGFDEEALYIMTRCISFSGGHLYNKIRVINKSELYSSNGGSLTYTDFWDIRMPGQGSSGAVLDCINPGISFTPGNGGWFFWAMGIYGGNPVSSDFYALYRVVNPLTAPTIRGKALPVQMYTSPPLANQLGGGMGIETIGWITKGPVIRDGFLYAAHDIQNSTNSNYSSIKYLKINLSNYSIVDNIEFGSAGYFYLFPAITIDKDHNAAITYSRSADTEYIGAYYSTKYADESFLTSSRPIAVGNGNYVLTYGGNINRWGDYFGMCLDPANEYECWMISEFAAAPNIWSTQVGHIRMVPFPGAYAFVQPSEIDFGDVEKGTKSTFYTILIANYGDSDLNISNIPNSFGDFNLETSLSFPVTISSYDSLTIEFSFSPTTTGDTSIFYPVNSNDPAFAGITMSGNGYEINPALEKTIYASSGSQNSGNILTINPLTGSGTLVGSSLYSEVKGITINPLTGIIYGLISNTTNSDIVRINAEQGDSYLLFQINLPSMADIAFDTLGILYGINVSGELYTIDLQTGNTNFITDAVGSYSGVTFNPQTNELWATSRAITPPNNDAVFKVNLTNGDTSIIGHTGLNKITNDIVFDENNNLYGVIGSSTELSDFININTTDGTGTIVGSVGMKNILGLAYTESSPTSVEDDKNNNQLPRNFSLSQNYPNPFNPATRIEFSIPLTADVKLTVYNILGQQVIALINEQKPAGNYSINWNGTDLNGKMLSSGIYLYKIIAKGTDGKNFQETKKMIILK